MKRVKIVLAGFFAVLILFGFSQPASAPVDDPDLVIDPHGISVYVCSTFTIDIWIKNIPSGLSMTFFEFTVSWDPAMMELVTDSTPADTRGWWGQVGVNPDNGLLMFGAFPRSGGSPWVGDAVWLTLTFHCIGEGSSEISVSGQCDLSNGQTVTGPLDEDTITCNQRQRPASSPIHVGGEVFSANKLAVLSPYLALIGVVAVAAFALKKRKI